MTRRTFISSAMATQISQRSPRPNLVFVVTDGWRGQALPFAGDTNLHAPNLSRLAQEGIYCSRAYTSYPVCCPSRAAMITGKFPHTVGVSQNHTRLPLEHTTMSSVLKDEGYRTGYIGKWHLDGNENPGFVPPERRRGFDYWAAYNLAHQHFDGVYFRDTPTPIRTSGFEADYQTDLAIEFLRQPSPGPFFLYLSLVPPHAPFTPPAKYSGYKPGELRLRANVPDRIGAATRGDLAGYYGLCSAVDTNLGRIWEALDQRGLTNDTIVVFTSDHGQMLGSHGLSGIDLPFEESSRIPLIIRYARRIKPGREYSLPVSNVDYAPTLLSLCGARLPGGMHGTNLAAVLTDASQTRKPRPIYAEGGLGTPDEWRMIVLGFDKLVVGPDLRPTQMYNLRRDPLEPDNRVGRSADRRKLEALLALIWMWRAQTDRYPPTPARGDLRRPDTGAMSLQITGNSPPA
jgi:arylsulfatase A-like enzyme